MKKVFFGFALFLMFVMSSCSDNSPKSVAQKFLSAMENQEFKEAEKYSDESMKQLLDMLDQMPKDNNKKAENAKVKVTRVEEKGDKAKVFYIVESKEIKGEVKEQSIDLKKVDGQWKVSFNKEDMNKEDMKNQEKSIDNQEESIDNQEESVSEDVIEEIEKLQESDSLSVK